MKFIDEALIHIEAGHGGRGCVSFRREKYVPRGGPDGGDGGNGGSVIFSASEDLSTLMDFRYRRLIRAKGGSHGLGKNMTGACAADERVPVPVGTVIFDAASGDVLADLVKPGDEIIVAQGGRGGKGNAHFATSTHQAPMKAQEGMPGEVRAIRLELKLLADVALIGLPNAGKSTFLSVISSAHPKIADYPFTTLAPVLGVVSHKDFPAFVVADLPGLIEGAHVGKGLGHKFLKHSERTRVFVHLVSVSPDEGTDAITRYKLIEKELKSYDPEFKKRKKIVLLTKCELADKKTLASIKKDFAKLKIKPFAISSATRLGLEAALDAMVRVLSK